MPRRRPALGLAGFDHVDLSVPNRAALARFFVERMGMQVLGAAKDHTFLLFHNEVLGLHDAPPGTPANGVDHLALRVARWKGLREALEAAGVPVVAEKVRDDSRSLFVEAPGGLRLELIRRPHPERHPAPHRM